MLWLVALLWSEPKEWRWTVESTGDEETNLVFRWKTSVQPKYISNIFLYAFDFSTAKERSDGTTLSPQRAMVRKDVFYTIKKTH